MKHVKGTLVIVAAGLAGCLCAIAFFLSLIGSSVPLGRFLVQEHFVPVQTLADADSLFLDVQGLSVHCKVMGEGELALLLLHGFGASIFSWREVIGPLGARNKVVAFDRPGFGLTERPMPEEWAGANPYTLKSQVDLTVALMGRLNLQEAVLVGHSAGGLVAVLTAWRYPEKVKALVLISPAVYQRGNAIPDQAAGEAVRLLCCAPAFHGRR